MPSEIALVALFVVGVLSSVLNTVAGGGSYLTLPLLMALGLSPVGANATNRVGVLAGLCSSTWAFARARLLHWSDLWRYALPATLGGVVGAWAALRIPDGAFRVVLALLMLFGSWTVLRRPEPPPGSGKESKEPPRGLAELLFSGVGVYAGFIQAGTGFFAMAAASALGLDLRRGNAVKSLMNLCLTVPALVLFALGQVVHWPLGLALALGMSVGGAWGAKLSQKSSPERLRRWVALAIGVSAVMVAAPLFSSR